MQFFADLCKHELSLGRGRFSECVYFTIFRECEVVLFVSDRAVYSFPSLSLSSFFFFFNTPRNIRFHKFNVFRVI